MLSKFSLITLIYFLSLIVLIILFFIINNLTFKIIDIVINFILWIASMELVNVDNKAINKNKNNNEFFMMIFVLIFIILSLIKIL